MVDLHCHIIPWVDDGAENAEAACRMAQIALRSGVDTVVATPHCNLLGARPNHRGRKYAEGFSLFRALLRQREIPLTVLPGAEVFAHNSNLRTLLDEERVVTLNHSRYLLLEFNFHSSASNINTLLEATARRGYIPVIAHPERYQAVQSSPGIALQWCEKGYIIQLNKSSLLARLGEAACDTAQYLLSSQAAHVIASDAHDVRARSPGFQSLLPLLHELCSKEYIHALLEDNPRRIISDQSVPMSANYY